MDVHRGTAMWGHRRRRRPRGRERGLGGPTRPRPGRALQPAGPGTASVIQATHLWISDGRPGRRTPCFSEQTPEGDLLPEQC